VAFRLQKVLQRVVTEGRARRFEVDIVEADGSNLEALQRESPLLARAEVAQLP
jgi:hypothetical protein